MLNIKLEQIHAFLHTARRGDGQKAANALHLSQPAITARIKNLEQVLGTSLFDRAGGTRQLNRSGEVFLEYADQLLFIMNNIERDVANPSAITSRIRIGLAETVAQCWMPTILAEIQKHFPKLQIELHVDVSHHLHDSLEAREIDLSIALSGTNGSAMSSLSLPPLPLLWYTCASDAVNNKVEAKNFFQKPVITYPRSTRPFREMRDGLWKHFGLGVKFIPSSSMSSALRLVAAGTAVAALPATLGKDEEKRGTVAQFDPEWHPNPMQFEVQYSNNPTDPLVEEIAYLIEQVVE
ncbi:MAG: LysR family transcriptional regulator [Granulosicoccus sp.]